MRSSLSRTLEEKSMPKIKLPTRRVKKLCSIHEWESDFILVWPFHPCLARAQTPTQGILLLFRTCIENNYLTLRAQSSILHTLEIKKHALNQALYTSYHIIIITYWSHRVQWIPYKKNLLCYHQVRFSIVCFKMYSRKVSLGSTGPRVNIMG